MGTKLLWFGLTVLQTGGLTHIPAFAGAIIMVVGLALLLLDK